MRMHVCEKVNYSHKFYIRFPSHVDVLGVRLRARPLQQPCAFNDLPADVVVHTAALCGMNFLIVFILFKHTFFIRKQN